MKPAKTYIQRLYIQFHKEFSQHVVQFKDEVHGAEPTAVNPAKDKGESY